MKGAEFIAEMAAALELTQGKSLLLFNHQLHKISFACLPLQLLRISQRQLYPHVDTWI